jgi:hypothetical protein
VFHLSKWYAENRRKTGRKNFRGWWERGAGPSGYAEITAQRYGLGAHGTGFQQSAISGRQENEKLELNTLDRRPAKITPKGSFQPYRLVAPDWSELL